MFSYSIKKLPGDLNKPHPRQNSNLGLDQGQGVELAVNKSMLMPHKKRTQMLSHRQCGKIWDTHTIWGVSHLELTKKRTYRAQISIFRKLHRVFTKQSLSLLKWETPATLKPINELNL
jgi:hypothetical protein